jgi:glutathione peroxidase
MSFYNISAQLINGEDQSFLDYKGKVILVVNTASKCGFTPQYAELEELYKKYSDKLVVLAFPCNQFGKQEPGDDSEVASFCDLTFKTTFPIFSKIEVNGDNSHDLYIYLKKDLPGFMGIEKIKWNFTKFLIDKEGKPIKRYSPQTKPMSISKDIEKLIND